jgi:hypothetical protein
MHDAIWSPVAGEPGRADYTDRLRVLGGWLYRTRVHEGVAMTFAPAAAGGLGESQARRRPPSSARRLSSREGSDTGG